LGDTMFANIFGSPIKSTPNKYCDELAYECALKLKKKYPNANVTTISGPVVDKDGKVLFENGKLQFHRMAAIVRDDGGWEFYDNRHDGLLVKVDKPEWWSPSIDVGVVRYRPGMTKYHNRG
jgi:hypothetical protein